MLYILTYNNLIDMIPLINLLETIFIIFGVCVIIAKNPIVSILYLIGLFLLVSIYLILIGINFIGISYLLVYIGAVSILFLFILMLIDIRLSELQINTMNNLIIASLLGIGLYIPVFNIFKLNNNYYNYHIDHINHNSWEGFILENSDITTMGNIIYTNVSLWLILSLLVLLLAMVGAIVINLDNKFK